MKQLTDQEIKAEFARLFMSMPSFIGKQETLYLHFTAEVWRNQTIYPLTEDQIQAGIKHPKGFIANVFGVDLYITPNKPF